MDNLNPLVYLLFYSVIVISLLLMFLRGRRPTAPSRLRFGPRTLPGTEGSDITPKLIFGSKDKQSFPKTKARQLNILFNYNGETFDAFEILGLPAGSSFEAAHAHYSKHYAAKKQNERALYDAAILALEKSKNPAASA